MKEENLLATALAHLVCPVCCKKCESVILMNEKLDKKHKAQVEAVHDKVIGFSDKPCKECSELLEKNDLIIEVDLEKTTDKNNPYRTGRVFHAIPNSLPDRIVYADKKDMELMIEKHNADKQS